MGIEKSEKQSKNPKKPKENKTISKPKKPKKLKKENETKITVKPKKTVKRLKPAKAKPAKASSAETDSAQSRSSKEELAKAKSTKAKPAKVKPAKTRPPKTKPTRTKQDKIKKAKAKRSRSRISNSSIQQNLSVSSGDYALRQVEAWCKGDCLEPSEFKKDIICEDIVVPVRMVLHGPLIPFPNYSGRITSFICNHLAYVAVGTVVLNVFLFTRNLNDLRSFKTHPFLCYLHPIFCSSFNLFAALGILMMYKYDSATFMFVLNKRKKTSVFCKILAYVCLCFGTLFLFHYAPWSFYEVNYPDSLHSWFVGKADHLSPLHNMFHLTTLTMCIKRGIKWFLRITDALPTPLGITGVVAVILGFSSLTFVMKDYRWGQKKRKLTEFMYAIAFIFNFIAMSIAIINCIMFTSFPYANVLYRTVLVLLCVFIVILVTQKPIMDWYKAYVTKEVLCEEEINIH